MDFDSIPKDGVDLRTAMRFLLSPGAASLRALLVEEAAAAGDILLRQGVRKSLAQMSARAPRPPSFVARLLPRLLQPEHIQVPVLIPKWVEGEEGAQAVGLKGQEQGRGRGRQDVSGAGLGTEAWDVVLASPLQVLEAAAPKLSREEEFYAISLKVLASLLPPSSLEHMGMSMHRPPI